MCTVDQEILDHPLTKDKVIERLGDNRPIRDPAWAQVAADGAKTRSGKDTLVMVETDANTCVFGRRVVSVPDPISGVSFFGQQVKGILCLPLACVNALSGILTLEQVVDHPERPVSFLRRMV
jgi:hypothetical protein